MYKPHTIEQYKIQQFLDHTFAMEHFLEMCIRDRCSTSSSENTLSRG